MFSFVYAQLQRGCDLQGKKRVAADGLVLRRCEKDGDKIKEACEHLVEQCTECRYLFIILANSGISLKTLWRSNVRWHRFKMRLRDFVLFSSWSSIRSRIEDRVRYLLYTSG